MEKNEHHLLLQWLIFSGVVLFGLVVALERGWMQALIAGDQSKLCLVMDLLYALASAHCAWRAWVLSRELNNTRTVLERVRDQVGSGFSMNGTLLKLGNGIGLPEGITANYLSDLLRAQSFFGKENNQGALAEILINRVKGPHEVGWFIADLMIKLGLLGTIVGFIFMLASISDISTTDVSSMQKALKQMSSGMGTALYTTLVGLVGSMLLAAQYALLDRAGG
jgi:MotA/TolQ/ExbB proton channel family